MGVIIIVVAVFETHIERNAVATMNPRMIRLGPVPIARIVRSAMRQ